MKFIKTKIVLVLFFIPASVTMLKAQDAGSAAMYRNIRAQAQAYAENLYLYRDYTYAVAHIYPPVVQNAGGAQNMKDALKKDFAQFDELDNQNIIYSIDVAIGTPAKVVDTAQQLQCIIPDTMTVTVVSTQFMKKTMATTPLIGISENGGNTWYFWTQGDDSYEKKKAIVPTLSSQLIFLPNQKPVSNRK